LVVYLGKERLVGGAGKEEGWNRRGLKRKEVEDGSRIERKLVPEHVVCEWFSNRFFVYFSRLCLPLIL